MQVLFNGQVSAQAQEGEEVTVHVYDHLGQETLVTATTQADGSWQVTHDFPVDDYTCRADIPQDELYENAMSDTINFSVVRQPRTITITATPQ